jgi:hypothetical protein
MTENKLNNMIQELENNGTFCSSPSPDIKKYLNMGEWDYGNLNLVQLEEAMGRVVDHINYLQDEINKAIAREYVTGNKFKRRKIIVYGGLIESQKKGKNSIEERNDLVCNYDIEADALFEKWEDAKVAYFLIQDKADKCLETLNVMKKIHTDMMDERKMT